MSFLSESAKAHYEALSSQTKIEFIYPEPDSIDDRLLNFKLRPDYLRLQAIPLKRSNEILTIGTADISPENLAAIRHFFGKKGKIEIEVVLISLRDLTHILTVKFAQVLRDLATHSRDKKDFFHSAAFTFSFREQIFVITCLIILVLAALGDFFYTALWVNVFLATGTLVIMSYKMGLTLHTFKYLIDKPKERVHIKGEYPIYTILLPMFREKEETIKTLLTSLARLDYPNDKLDIKFLLEEEDLETLELVEKFNLPWNYQVVVVPLGYPQSKPRACNFGLAVSYGKYLTIYDAEDRPDHDQISIALNHFNDAPSEVACLQAALNFYNYKENIITKLFTVEYTHWFDCLIPALDEIRAPVPLGGTSNHFKTSVLREIGGWDPYIGTEDAEIGVRLYRHNYRVNAIKSTTYEEANVNLKNWFLQRARWNKGYMQTYLVNMRDPLVMFKQIGAWKFLNFQFFVGGNVFIQFANLPLWIFLISTLFFMNTEVLAQYPKLLIHISWFNFILGNLIFLSAQFMATYKRKLYCLLPFVPLKLVYWFLMSFAGYYAVFELLIRPGYWYKTEHGLTAQVEKTDIPLDTQ